MNNIHSIRQRLGLSQAAFGEAIGVSQGNVSHYEQGRQEVPPAVARRVIEAAAERGHSVTYDDIYGVSPTVSAEHVSPPGGGSSHSSPSPLSKYGEGAKLASPTVASESIEEPAATVVCACQAGVRKTAGSECGEVV